MHRRANLIRSTTHFRFRNRAGPKLASRGVNDSSGLEQLALRHGVQLSYRGMDGQTERVSHETLAAILQTMGVSPTGERSLRDALRAERLRRWREPIEPVILAWDGAPAALQWRFQEGSKHDRYARLCLEDGSAKAIDLYALPQGRLKRARIEGRTFCTGRVALPSLPFGYHWLEFQSHGQLHRSLIIAAPTRSYSPDGDRKNWGIFLPMYALHSQRSWGAGDLGDWQALTEYAGSVGANVIATLPLLSCFLGTPICDPSPYAPVSRLFGMNFMSTLPKRLDLRQRRSKSSSIPPDSNVESKAFEAVTR